MKHIDIDIFSDNVNSTINLLQIFLDMDKIQFKKSIYKMDKTNTVIPGYKSKYIDKTNNLTIELSVYDEKHKEAILYEHRSKFNLPIHITIVLVILKILHYNLGILPIYYYSKFKKLLTNNFYDSNKSEFVVIDM